MYISFQNKIFRRWHIGESKREIIIYPSQIEAIQADGDELDVILNSFHNLPCHKSNMVQTWTGDIARFIWDNL